MAKRKVRKYGGGPGGLEQARVVCSCMWKSGQSVYSDAFGFRRVVRSYGEKTLVDFGDRQRTILNKYLSAQVPTIYRERNGAREAWLKPCPRWLM